MAEGITTPLIPILGQWAKIAFLVLINRLKFLNILAQHLSFWNQAEALCPYECDIGIVLPVEWWRDWSLLHTSAKRSFGNGASMRPRRGEQFDCSSEEDSAGHSSSATSGAQQRSARPQLCGWLLQAKPDLDMHKQHSWMDFFVLCHWQN